MIRVAIVEDQAEAQEALQKCLSYVEEQGEVRFSIQIYDNALSFLEEYKKQFDLVFMDIELPGMNGMECARELRWHDQEVILIFVTNLAQYAISGYEVDAMDFLLKPVNRYAFSLKLRRVLNRLAARVEETISVRSEREIRVIAVSDLMWMDMDGHYVVYHTLQGEIQEYITLKEACGRIQQGGFVHVNRGCVVNLRYVESVSRESVLVRGNQLDLARPQRKNFLAAMSAFLGGKEHV